MPEHKQHRTYAFSFPSRTDRGGVPPPPDPPRPPASRIRVSEKPSYPRRRQPQKFLKKFFAEQILAGKILAEKFWPRRKWWPRRPRSVLVGVKQSSKKKKEKKKKKIGRKVFAGKFLAETKMVAEKAAERCCWC